MNEDRIDALSRLANSLRDRIEDLEAEVERLNDDMTDLRRVVDPAPEAQDYDSLSREQKVFRLRVALVRDAQRSNGHAAMTYDAVQALFDNRPSPGHAYDLMELAADADGFDYDETKAKNRITVKTAAVKDDAVIRGANKAISETPA